MDRVLSCLTLIALLSACGGGGGGADALERPAADPLLLDIQIQSFLFTLDPAFDPDVTDYRVAGFIDPGLRIRPVAVPGAVVRVNGAQTPSGTLSEEVPLAYGANTIRVDVSTPQGQAQRYTLEVQRIDGFQAYLKSPDPQADDGFGEGVCGDQALCGRLRTARLATPAP